MAGNPFTPAHQGSTSASMNNTTNNTTPEARSSIRRERRKLKRKAKFQTPEGKRIRSQKRTQRRERIRQDNRDNLAMQASMGAEPPSPCKWCLKDGHWSAACPDRAIIEARIAAKIALRRKLHGEHQQQERDKDGGGEQAHLVVDEVTRALFTPFFDAGVEEAMTLDMLRLKFRSLQRKALLGSGLADGERGSWNAAVQAGAKRAPGRVGAVLGRLLL